MFSSDITPTILDKIVGPLSGKTLYARYFGIDRVRITHDSSVVWQYIVEKWLDSIFMAYCVLHIKFSLKWTPPSPHFNVVLYKLFELGEIYFRTVSTYSHRHVTRSGPQPPYKIWSMKVRQLTLNGFQKNIQHCTGGARGGTLNTRRYSTLQLPVLYYAKWPNSFCPGL